MTVTTWRPLLAAATALVVPRRAARQRLRRACREHRAPGDRQAADRDRARGSGDQRRPGGDPGRAAGAAPRRQRGRCGGGRRRHAGGHRALLHRHRRRWLLRVLRRQGEEGPDHRRPGDRAAAPTTADTYRGLTFDEAVNSGLSVGVPGTPATWVTALRRWGTRSLASSLAPAAAVARRGFVVDQTFHDQTAANAARFADILPTRRLFLPGGQPPAVGSIFRNPALARTYDRLAAQGRPVAYAGRLGREIVRTVRTPAEGPGLDPERPSRPAAQPLTSRATARSAASRRACATAACGSGACRRPRAAGRPSARR